MIDFNALNTIATKIENREYPEQDIPINSIVHRHQARAKSEDLKHIQAIRDSMEAREQTYADLPPAVLCQDGHKQILIDGNNRWAALKAMKETKIKVIILDKYTDIGGELQKAVLSDLLNGNTDPKKPHDNHDLKRTILNCINDGYDVHDENFKRHLSKTHGKPLQAITVLVKGVLSEKKKTDLNFRVWNDKDLEKEVDKYTNKATNTVAVYRSSAKQRDAIGSIVSHMALENATHGVLLIHHSGPQDRIDYDSRKTHRKLEGILKYHNVSADIIVLDSVIDIQDLDLL